jgi:hypothetical protein
MFNNKQTEHWRTLSNKHEQLFLLMSRFLCVKQDGKDISEWFARRGYETVAVYGLGAAGRHLLRELAGSRATIKYAIDKIASDDAIPVLRPDDIFPPTDVIVVTAVSFFDEIEDMLIGKTECPIVSLEDLLYEV